jgi:DNA-binding FadR family transcriptional regulator
MDILSHSREESLQTPGRSEDSLASHERILSAIENHDRNGAHKAMLHHIEKVEQNIISDKDKLQVNYIKDDIDERRIS